MSIRCFIACTLLASLAFADPIRLIADSSCPKNCSSNGLCVQGICKCDPGFQTADCSFPCGKLGQTCCQAQCVEGLCLVHDGKADGVCSSYGGLFVSGSKDGCLSPNPYTRDCACPADYKTGCVTVHVPSVAADVDLCFCHGQDGPDFAGYYQPSSSGCEAANPATGACSCPQGTTALGPIELFVAAKPNALRLFACAAAGFGTGSYPFGGLFELDDDAKQTCQLPNPASAACSCPSVLSNADLVSCPDYFPVGVASGLTGWIGACSTAHKNAGIVMSIAQSGFKQFLLDAIEFAIKNSQKISIPDISGHDYEVKDMQFTSLKFSSISVAFSRPDVISMSFAGGAMDGSIGEIKVSDGIVSTHCDAHPFDLSDISIDFELDMSLRVHAGRMQPRFAPGALTAKCGGVECIIHGNALCDTFGGDITDAIKKAVENDFPTSIAAEIKQAVARQGAILSRNISEVATVFPITVPHSPIEVTADMSLTGCGPVLQSNPSLPVLQLPLRGAFFARNGPLTHAELTFSPPPLATPPIGTKDVQLCMSPYVFDAAMWVLFESEAATVEITNAQLPKNFPASLNTSNIIMRDLAPSINTIYPNDAMIVRIAMAASQPGASSASSNVTAAGLAFAFDVSAEFLVVSSNDTQPANCVAHGSGSYLCSAYRLSAHANANVTLALVEGAKEVRLTAQVAGLELSWSLVSSNVGTVQVSILQSLDVLLVPEAQKFINAKLANSTFALPTVKGLVRLYDFTQPIYVPAADAADGFLCVDSNLELNKSFLFATNNSHE
eukprot:TRINITY_DN6118_c1_g1_i1.p1 TRINITY_DN6118_c1_g1~~TRINITY_DN6118_c1_g1_i1.p1  ORF type:complete len:783 (+),score=271.49 TRINITY_DN6118_c1_g1_i1:37-2385(+)